MSNCPTETNPLALPRTEDRKPIVSLNYTNQDFQSLLTRIVERVNERFGPQGSHLPNTFNDFSEGQMAVVLMEVLAFVGDMLSFKIDQLGNEINSETVTQLDNAFRMARGHGMEPTPPIAARTMWTATIQNVLTQDVVMDAPVPIEVAGVDGPIRIELFAADAENNPVFDEPIVVPAGKTVNSAVVGLEGRTVLDEFSGTGETLQTYQLARGPVIYDSITVSVDGQTWERVASFSDSKPRPEYRVEFDHEYNAYLYFGNNSAGLSPSPGARIEARYRVGGGVRGNITTNFIETQRQAEVPGLRFSIPVTLRNYTRGEYGYDGDGIEDIRRKLPAYNRTQDRCVSGEDYKTLAEQFTTPYHGQVGKAAPVLRNRGCAGNIIDVFILAREGEAGLTSPSNGLKTALLDFYKRKQLADVCVKDGEVLYADVFVEAVLKRTHRRFEAEVKTQIERRVTAFFNVHDWDFGRGVSHTDLAKALADIRRVDGYEIHFQTDDDDNGGDQVVTQYYQVLRPDQITVSFTYTD